VDQTVSLRRAQKDDYEFAWKVYSAVVKPQMAAHLKHEWTDDEQKRRFATIWKPENAMIGSVGDVKVGWFAHVENKDEIILEHGYVLPEYQRRGFGSKVLTQLLEGFKGKGKPITLEVLKNSPYRGFFERFGFQAAGEKDITVLMKQPTA
jgi:ribosomal protein S18 acetylase RimI-like enzyme